MKRTFRLWALGVGGLLACGVAVPTMAQSMAAGVPRVTDTRTGKVWTPDIEVPGQRTDPGAYVNRAFDPRGQSGGVEGIVVQHPRANLMGTVPIAAGPTVPIVALDAPSLQAIPARHWLAILYVTNNSGSTIDVVVGCEFTNNGQRVQSTRVIVPPAGPGERLGMAVRGPPTNLFVDRATCHVITPT